MGILLLEGSRVKNSNRIEIWWDNYLHLKLILP